ncbi:MAG: phosphatase PAP2 family protein [Odoribacteraceae bacterium]|jgi:undecaprenyl-diphosphatase|nr:phosphatase PAP2 family protein [Odoribacteraceae bacterium]
MWEVLQEWDQQLLLAINGMHCPRADRLAGLFAGKETWAVMYAAILLVLCRNFNWRGVIAATAAFALLVLVADQLTSTVLRPLFARPRPSRAAALEEIVHLVNGRRGGAFGFPSAHAANTAALTTFLFLFTRRQSIAAFFIAWTVATCYARVYAGVHYPADVAAGVIVGFLSGLTVHAAYRYLRARVPSLAPRRDEGLEGTRVILLAGLLTVAAITLFSLLAPA